MRGNLDQLFCKEFREKCSNYDEHSARSLMSTLVFCLKQSESGNSVFDKLILLLLKVILRSRFTSCLSSFGVFVSSSSTIQYILFLVHYYGEPPLDSF